MQRKNMIERKQNPEQKGRTILRNILITVGIMGAATIVCLALQHFSEADTHVPLLFVLAVVIVARFTEGYVYGILSAMAAVVLVNYVFTYPYFELNFSITGYPLTFVVMLATAVMVSALTTQIKWQEQIRLEVEKEKTRANLLRAVSHDLRTPLTSMIGASSSYLENETTLSSPEKRDLVSHIYEDANWLLHMVENLLSVTRITDGISNTLKETPEVAEEVLFDAVSTIRKRYPDYQIQVSVPGDFYVVPMDPLLIKQVIINLLENAYFHARSEQPVQCYLTGDDAQIQVHIRDHGNGIAPDRLKSIFDAAPSAPSSAADTKRGMGIGLSICKAIITAHNGEIHAINHADGAEFFFNLPKEAISHESEHSDSGHRR